LIINVTQLAFDLVAAEDAFACQLFQGKGSGSNLFAPVPLLALGGKDLYNFRRREYGQGTGMLLKVAGNGLLIPANKVAGAGCCGERRWEDDHYRARSCVEDLARGAPGEEAADLLARGATATTNHDEVNAQFPRGPHNLVGGYTYPDEHFYL